MSELSSMTIILLMVAIFAMSIDSTPKTETVSFTPDWTQAKLINYQDLNKTQPFCEFANSEGWLWYDLCPWNNEKVEKLPRQLPTIPLDSFTITWPKQGEKK